MRDNRINGALNVSRTIGDLDFKRNAELPHTEQMVGAPGGWVGGGWGGAGGVEACGQQAWGEGRLRCSGAAGCKRKHSSPAAAA